MSTLNFAIIGCGGVTLQNHLRREVRTTVTVTGPGGATGSKQVTVPPMAQIQEMIVFTPQAEGEGGGPRESSDGGVGPLHHLDTCALNLIGQGIV